MTKILALLLLAVCQCEFSLGDNKLLYEHIKPSAFSKDGVLEFVDKRIVGGEITDASKVPYQCYIESYGRRGGSSCGCTLVSTRSCLTAAHCTFRADYSYVVPGVSDLRRPTRVYLVQRRWGQIIEHPSWNMDTMDGDIALLILSRPLQLGPTIGIAVLAPPETAGNEYWVGSRAIISGFGQTGDVGSLSMNLRSAETMIEPIYQCDLPPFLNGSYICTIFEGTGVCYGDSGGPLVVKRGNENICVGVTSFGAHSCEEINAPNVFTKVAAYYYWIRSASRS